MYNIATCPLVDLGLKRRISSYLDRVWEERTKINPVSAALEYGLLARYLDKVSLQSFVSAMLVAFCAAMGAEKDWTTPVAMAFGVTALLVGVAIFASVFNVVVYLAPGTERKAAYAEIQAFLADYEYLCRLVKSYGAVKPMHLHNEEEVQVVARKAMLSCARHVRSTERGINPQIASTFNAKVLADQEIRECYDALNRLGLVSDGYGEFFEEVDRENAKRVA